MILDLYCSYDWKATKRQIKRKEQEKSPIAG